ncbi:MAG: hypothetical protein JNM68_00820 [Dinghuibacter sp.]|nr:hypothetical protein [Dinghuibacter sp.]
MQPGQVRLFTVSNRDSFYKQTQSKEAIAAGVFRVPTFIFYNSNGEELGRIIESPVQQLEKDMQAILGGTTYHPRYEHIHQLLNFCTKSTDGEFSRNLTTELTKLKDSSYFSAAVTNLVMVMMAGGKAERAGALSLANEQLFPGDLYALTGRARYFRYIGDAATAAAYSRKILEKDPENAAAKEILAGLNM